MRLFALIAFLALAAPARGQTNGERAYCLAMHGPNGPGSCFSNVVH